MNRQFPAAGSGHATAAVAESPLQMRMACPDCSAGIDLSLPSLLLGRPLWCGGCGAKLEIDLAASADVLERIRESAERLRAVRDRGAGPGRG